jgi:putative membrane protein
MKKITLFSALGASALVLSLLACESKKQDTASNDESIEMAEDANDSTFTERTEEKDADFVVNAVTSNLAEIKIAQLAKNKSSNEAVKTMATTLEEQHMKILNELKAYADKNGIAIPLQESDKDAKEMNKLAEESADKFDEKWCDAMEDRHEKSINKFESRLDKTEDPELKEWIVATLPGLKEHLSMIENHDKAHDGE